VTFSSTDGAGAAVFTSGGTASGTFSVNTSTGTAGIHTIFDSVPTTDALADVSITLDAPTTLPSASTSGTIVIGGTEPVTDANCAQVAAITASGAFPVSGSVTAGVTIDPSVQSVGGQPYVTRHYDITPASNASTATATITLYFLQSEFNAYNAVVNNSAVELPTSSSDLTGRANLTITQFHGSGTAPGNYSGWTGPGPESVLISPGSSNVVWNSAKSWWEVSFPVTGFSGFYITGPISQPLPLVLTRFSGMLQGAGVLLSWQVEQESGLAQYDVEGSTDGVSYLNVGEVASAGGAAGGSGGSYQYFVADPAVGENYYRLKMVNTDGTFSYSNVVVVAVAGSGQGITVLGNPFVTSCMVRVTAATGAPVSLRLTDISGKLLWHEEMVLSAGTTTFILPQTAGLAPGVYLLSLMGTSIQQTVKVVKVVKE
jgi:hypothetical protein